MEGVQRETNRRRMERLREQAEGISRLAGWLGVDMTAIGEIVVGAERAVKAHLGVVRYSAPVSFGGDATPVQTPDPAPQPPIPVMESRARHIQTDSPPPPPNLSVAERVDDLSVDTPAEQPPPRQRSMKRTK
jgi:hypothetical protein